MKIEIKVPIWGKRAIGIANYKITEDLEVTISYKDVDGNLVYPGIYRMSKDKALSYPTQTIKQGIVLHIIPIRDFDHG